MDNMTQALRLLQVMERVQEAGEAAPKEGTSDAAKARSMTVLLTSLIATDFDLGSSIVDTADGA